jgi:aarF domain-containing kinase
VFENIRRFRRTFRVARTGARVYLGYKRTQRRVRTWSPEAAAAEWERQHERAAERLYRLAIDLKGLYIKIGQFIGTRSDLVPAAYTRSLSRLQDRVPPRPAALIRETIAQELGRPIEELFETFDDRALGAASLAQVHRATLPGGREVVVKVQYPEVGGLVKLDLRNLRTIVGLVARREPNFDYRSVVNEMARQVPNELEFEHEAEMMRRVGANLAEIPGVTVPEVIDEYVSRKVLVTAYVHGHRLLGQEHIADASIDGPALAARIAGAYGHQILIDGLFQADPHPGNILVLPGGEIALLDFGLTKELPETVRLGFARLVIAVASRDMPAILGCFRELGVKTRTDEPADVFALLSLFFDPRDHHEGVGNHGRTLGATFRQNPVEAIPGDLVLLGRVVGLLRGVSASLGTPLSPMQMLRPYAERALAEAGRDGEPVAAS